MKVPEYLLVCLGEEAAEITQATSKTLRFGPHQVYPDTTTTNVMQLKLELSQLMGVLELLQEELPDIDLDISEYYKEQKKLKIRKFIGMAKRQGIIDVPM